MRVRGIAIALAAGTVAAFLVTPRSGAVHAQAGHTTIRATDASSLRAWDQTVTSMSRVGELRVRRVDEDPVMRGRQHERLDQYYKGIRVRGGDVVRQTAAGSTVSIFGSLHEDIDIDVTPTLSADAALAVAARESGMELGASRVPKLMVVPYDGSYRLAYVIVAFTPSGASEYFVDANDGSLIFTLDAARRQSAVGRGTGVLGDTKKLSVTRVTGGFQASDLLRPPVIRTYDMKSDVVRLLNILNGIVPLLVSDRAADSDNTWTDVAAVDAHAYAGFVYDYYFKAHGRRGLDNANVSLLSFVHPVSRSTVTSQPAEIIGMFYLNAFYAGDGIMVYGEGLPPGFTLAGQSVNYFSGALDIVAHELTHGVTDYSSQLIYENESGALNEAFSDMMGTAIEFYYQTPGSGALQADYLCGEDVVTPGGIRSLSDPAAFGQPDHYSRRFVVATPTPENDNGGVHINSGIPNHAYYLAIEGGTNRTSGLSVQGVGVANREQINRVMVRAFTQLMPAAASFSTARAVTIQAARDLYGTNSNVERAVTEAWNAVGVN